MLKLSLIFLELSSIKKSLSEIFEELDNFSGLSFLFSLENLDSLFFSKLFEINLSFLFSLSGDFFWTLPFSWSSIFLEIFLSTSSMIFFNSSVVSIESKDLGLKTLVFSLIFFILLVSLLLSDVTFIRTSFRFLPQ